MKLLPSTTVCIAALGLAIMATSCALSRYSQEEVLSDVDYLELSLETIHPDPFFVMPRQRFAQTLDSIRGVVVSQGKWNEKELYCLLNPVVASLRDGHTRLVTPNKINMKSFFWGSRILPLGVEVEGETLLVKHNLDAKRNPIPAGSEIVRLNGVEGESLLSTLINNNYGERDVMRRYDVNPYTFSRNLWLYMGFNKRFVLDYRTPEGVERQATLKGIYQPSFYNRLGKKNPKKQSGLVEGDNGHYYESADGSCGIIEYGHFGGAADSTFFHDVFALATQHGVEHLFLDLRGNGGGSTNTYPHILSYLTSDTLNLFSQVMYKVSPGLLDQKLFGDGFSYPSDRLGQVVTMDLSLFKMQPYETNCRYIGRFYCLSDAGTFSTASSFCALVHDYGLGSIVGEPTGGMGTSFGNFMVVQLPQSGLRLVVSTSKYFRTNGNTNFEPVQPNVVADPRNLGIEELEELMGKGE
ncbi:MAG: S41 family peptidase [Breznakibacter sp.]